jgi:hypothetical protein
MDQDDFHYTLTSPHGTFEIVMQSGELTINGAGYEFNEDDPTYAMALEIALLRQLVK